MPQMAPLSWTILMISFSALLMLSMIILFNQLIINNQKEPSSIKSTSMKKELNWKW